MNEFFILIGGASRSGTNGISAFIHLHDEISIIHAMEREQKFVLSKHDDLVEKCRTSKNTILSFGNNDWMPIFKEKRKKLQNGLVPRIVGIRWDFSETQYNHFQKGVKSTVIKMVYCMRPLEAIFKSLWFNNFIRKDSVGEAVEEFEKKMVKSLDALAQIPSRYAIRIWESGSYLGLLNYLGLEPNELQKKWMEDVPVVNNTGPQKQDAYKEFKDNLGDFAISKELKERYYSL